MQATEGWYEGRRVMLDAANEGANPSGGPLNRSLSVGNRKVSMRSEYMRTQAVHMWGNLLGVGNQDAAERTEEDHKEYGELFEIAESRRDNPHVDPAAASSRNPVPERNE